MPGCLPAGKRGGLDCHDTDSGATRRRLHRTDAAPAARQGRLSYLHLAQRRLPRETLLCPCSVHRLRRGCRARTASRWRGSRHVCRPRAAVGGAVWRQQRGHFSATGTARATERRPRPAPTPGRRTPVQRGHRAKSGSGRTSAGRTAGSCKRIRPARASFLGLLPSATPLSASHPLLLTTSTMEMRMAKEPLNKTTKWIALEGATAPLKCLRPAGYRCTRNPPGPFFAWRRPRSGCDGAAD